jgi:glycosyltransferase involved in cell wall biosynthesis
MKLILAGYVQNKPEDRAYFERIRGSIDAVVDIAGQNIGRDYYEKVMRPILASDAQVIFVGELAGEQTKHWYGHARATLFPIRWGEPFGMVLIESMASGTPVLAFDKGAVPEIVDDGRTGFILDSIDAMVAAVKRIDLIDRRVCREHVQTNFSTQLMAARYANVYARVVRPTQVRPSPPALEISLAQSRVPRLSAS